MTVNKRSEAEIIADWLSQDADFLASVDREGNVRFTKKESIVNLVVLGDKSGRPPFKYKIEMGPDTFCTDELIIGEEAKP